MTGTPAGIYTRISLASIGDTTKTDDQERICRDLAGRLGWTVTEIYCDHSKSAWQKNRSRPAWNQMLADVDAGKIRAIVVYHGDRLVRRPEDLADLLRLADSKGIKLASPTGTKDLDTERLELWIRAAFAEEESQRTSERRKSQYERWRRSGRVRPGGRGGRAFGFDTRGNVIESEAALIRHAAAMILEGHTTGDVGRWLAAQGAVTPAGNDQWGHSTVRQMLARPRYAGLMPDGVSEAAWPAILGRPDWEAVCAILDSRAAGFGYATNRARHLLSGIALCGRDGCAGPMQIWQSKGRAGSGYQIGYRCSKCKRGFRSQPLLDAYVSEAVVNRLNDPRNPAGQLPARPGLDAQYKTLAAARAELAVRLADPDEPYWDLLQQRLEKIDARLDSLRGQTSDAARLRLLAAHRGLTYEQFLALPLAVRRSLAAATFRIEVLPATRRGPGFNPDDVDLTPL